MKYIYLTPDELKNRMNAYNVDKDIIDKTLKLYSRAYLTQLSRKEYNKKSYEKRKVDKTDKKR